MLKITIQDSADELRFRLEGRLCGPWVGELRQCWLTAASTTGGRVTVLDMGEVDFIDSAGESLLAEMGCAGVKLVASTPFIQALVDSLSEESGCGSVKSDALFRASRSGHNPSAA